MSGATLHGFPDRELPCIGLVYGLGHRLPYVTGAIGLLDAWLVAMSLVTVQGEAR